MIRPRVDNIRARGRERDLGTDSAIARAAGIDPGGFNRLMRGKTRPGIASIEGLLNAFNDLKFEDLFERVPETADQP
ncbi:hypothetical protein [Actinomadura bangladeshensis]|uniref:Helix-turn-helix transcriptional regulator n=1 Tax=Actinomadura bangladeshensis TaxID=453573 RepID=A0A6L9QAI9_9ACTN|nr:hypothetical protein [Actinomadura bangladeshensis]NEA21540.1 hypothetical protein [Actinomadura bangladeshensis]NEA22500.1 hypothetical protein [Actinomadura bangladeshensis]